MKMMLLVTLCLCLVAPGEEPVKQPLVVLETRGVVYAPRVSHFFRAYAQALNRGYALGVIAQKKVSGDTRETSLSGIVEGLKKSVEELSMAQAATRKKTWELIEREPSAIPIQERESTEPAAVSEEPVRSEPTQFMQCAARTLPRLKLRLQMDLIVDDLNAGLLDTELAKERGDGRVISRQGVACGKYLGPMGFPNHQLQDDIKLLASMTSRSSKADRVELLTVLTRYARIRQGARTELGAFWEYAWKTVAFDAVFSSNPLVDMNRRIRGFLSELESAPGIPLVQLGEKKIVVKVDLEDARRRITQDLQTTVEVAQEWLQ